MKDPKHWTHHDLYVHLQHALDLELWTIPLYLSSLYSIKGLSDLSHHDYPKAAKLVFSVMVQEMLHAELVANLSNALGHKPKFNLPRYNSHKGIPFIHPSKHLLPEELKGYKVEVRPLDHEALKLFCAIEMPHPKTEITWEQEKSYNSIADLYAALEVGVKSLWNECYVGHEKNTKQKNAFNEYHNRDGKNHGFSIVIDSLDMAMEAMDAIVEQGEGADSKRVPTHFRPPEYHDEDAFDIAWFKGELSHYQKFKILLRSHNYLPETYGLGEARPESDENIEMKQAFIDLWSAMQLSFETEGEEMAESFWPLMTSISQKITSVWKSGAIPDLDFEKA